MFLVPNALPKFDDPPVVETVMSAQFDALPDFTTAHIGWYWQQCLDETWEKAVEIGSLVEQFERFEEEKKWGRPGVQLMAGVTPNRIQILKAGGERLIQLQPTRFIYNWRRAESGYPSYDKLLPEFRQSFEAFDSFAKESGVGRPKVNQWEITYVNHILKGTLWSRLDEWSRVLPWFAIPAATEDYLSTEGFVGEWGLEIGAKAGRLHVSLQHARVGSREGPESIALQLTARGPVTDEIDLFRGLEIGHETIVRSFAAMTSEEAHATWKRTDNAAYDH